MRLLIIHQPNSEQGRVVDEFTHEFSRIHPGVNIQLMDSDSVEAEDIIKLYDIMQYPAMLVQTDEGQLQHMWIGMVLPLMDEVMGYLNA